MTMAAKSCPARSASAGRASTLGGFDLVDQLVLARRQHAVRRQALDGERAGDADAGIVVIGLVVEIFDVGARGDGGVDLLLPGDARLPPFGVGSLRDIGRPVGQASRGICHSSQVLPSAALSAARSGSSTACHFSQMTSIRRCWRSI